MSIQLEQAKQTARKLLRRILWGLLVLLMLVGIGYYIYSQLTYSDGRKSGQLVKVSHRGILFKTYEGTLNLSPNGIMTAWDFSAANSGVAEKLQSFDGKIVSVHYRQRYQVFFWQGDTEFVVDEVQAVSQ